MTSTVSLTQAIQERAATDEPVRAALLQAPPAASGTCGIFTRRVRG